MQAGHANGISYILTENDPFATIDLDHCRCAITHSIDVWAQNFMDCGRHSYQEITPSGTGCRIWGFADGDPLNRKFTLEIDGKPIAAELFRRTNKALTITGHTLDRAIHDLGNIAKVIDWGVVWGERRKAAAAPAGVDGNGFASSNGCAYSIDEASRSFVLARRLELIAAISSIPSSATTSALVGTRSRSFSTCRSIPAALASATCAKIVCARRSPAVPLNSPSRSCSSQATTVGLTAGKHRRSRRSSRRRSWMMLIRT